MPSPNRYAAARKFRRYSPVHRSDPRDKYIRRNGCQYQVRIPLDGTGRLRLTLGSFPSVEEARFVRSRVLRQLGVSIDDDLPALYAAAKVWLMRPRS